MFDWSCIDELDANAASDALAEARREVLAAEAKQFVLAAHWADLTAGEYVDAVRAQLPGMQRLVPIRGGRSGGGCVDGCPEISEYAGAELAALLGRSTVAGEQLISDAVSVRHRHPLLWSAIHAGEATVWLASQAARRCIRAGLDAGQAEWVDAATTPYISTLTPSQFLELVDAKIIEVDPEAAEMRAEANALATFVHTGRTDEFGLRTMVARASAGKVTYVVAVLDRIAAILAERGDHRRLDVLRTEALVVLSNPARALALLTGASLEEADPSVETPGDLAREVLFPHGDTGSVCDTAGRPLPGSCPRLEELPLMEDDELAALPEFQALAGSGAVVGGGGADGVEEHADPALLRALLEALGRFDASRLDPVTVLHVHLSGTALTARQGVARVEGIGPMVLAEVRDWLAHPFSSEHIRHQVRVRPVIDSGAVVPVSRYEWPAPMSELSTCRTPYEVFPFGTLSSRSADDDHVRPYVTDGPPGQTSLENNAKLSRFHHRLKTNGNWVLRHPEPGIYWWRTPHGHWFLVDTEGTHWHGRDAALDRSWLLEDRAA